MEFRKEARIQGQWIPVTPAKPIPVMRQAPVMSGLNWGFDNVVGESGIPWSVPQHGQMAALASAMQGQIGDRASRESRALAFNSEGIAQMSLPHLMLGVGSSSSGRQEMHAGSSNRNEFLLPPNHENGGNWLPHQLAPRPQYMSEFPFLNLNLSPENDLSSTVFTQVMPPPAMPATMEKNQNLRGRIQDHGPSEIIDLEAETSSYQDLLHDRSSYQDLLHDNSIQLLQSLTDNPGEKCFSNPVEPSQIVTSQHEEGERNMGVIQEGEGAIHGIDLNETPSQKPKRKKHRPKVIREGKPARTPKPATPKPPNTTENPSGKRKYVRKKKDTTSPQKTPTNPQQDTPSSVGLGEVVDQDSRNRSKSVRRSLNFDSEGSQVVHCLSMPRQDVHGSQGQENAVTKNPPVVHCSQRRDPVAPLDSLMSRDVGYDLNRSTNQYGNESVGVPHTPSQPPRPSRQGMTKSKWLQDFERLLSTMKASPQPGTREEGNMNKLPTHASRLPSNLDRHLKDRQRQIASNTLSEVLFQGEKRGHSLVDAAQVSVNASLLDIHKRRRIEDDLKKPVTIASSTLVYPPNDQRAIHNISNITLANAQRLMALERSPNIKRMLDCLPPQTPEKSLGCINGQETGSYGPQARVDTLIAKQTKAKPRGRRRKEQDPPVNSMAPNANNTENVAAGSRVGCFPTTDSTPRTSTMKIAQHDSSPAQDRHKYQGTTSSYSQSGALLSYQDTMDEIVRKLRHLDINVGHEDIAIHPQNALVPYVGGTGAMVPFDGQFYLIKKRKPRPKVDLDPESHRVWNLLMGKESGEGKEETGIDKEKWWEEERRVFRGRADSFIARMHLIQGDRRFSRWKGSVLDSVIGVFLTQNVSDHLSSSAFMSLAARFSAQSKEKTKADKIETISRHIITNDMCRRRQGELSYAEFCGQSPLGFNGSRRMDNKEMVSSNESLESNSGGLEFHELGLGTGQESPDSTLGTELTVTSCASAVEGDDRKFLEDVVSSQISVSSSQNSSECPGQMTDQSQPSPLLNFEANELLTGGGINSFSSFRELLEMADEGALNHLKVTENGRKLSAEYSGMIDWSAAPLLDKSSSIENGHDFLNGSGISIYSTSCAPSSSCCHPSFSTSRFVGMEKANIATNGSSWSPLPSTFFEFNEIDTNVTVGRTRSYASCTGSSANAVDWNESLGSKIPPTILSGPINHNNNQPISTGVGARPLRNETQSYRQSEASLKKNVSSTCLKQDGANTERERTWKADKSHTEFNNCGTHKAHENLHNNNHRSEKVAESTDEANLRIETSTSEKVSAETMNSTSKGKKVKAETEKKSFDWDSLRREVCQNDAKKERSSDAMDSLDYEALRNADVSEISNTIRERGMNNLLAERIKDFLDRLVRDHGSMDLEWLRDIPPDKAKDYLLSIRGLGLKSVECIRLLTLHHLAFPVDTNVGRICVRLGWVPLQPLPESLQLHLLEMYPMLETIQKYLWPRLCKLDQRTLYELHYQLITFGKVFCTKSKPNCNSCPMRGECKHFASAFASARLALPGPEEKNLVSSEVHFPYERSHSLASSPVPLPQLEGSTLPKEQVVLRNCEPIIEEPATPEPEYNETLEIDIEDAFYNDPDEIPTIKLNFEEFTQNLQNYMQENKLGIQDDDMSKALVAVSPEAASIPMPKLKNINRLRTEHLVYELSDSHPLLERLDKRETDDPCPYLLAIWTPGETAQSTEVPTVCCNSQDTGKLCDKNTCFNCNSIRESQSQMVRGTLLIPCRTANRGSFPLNGTYFQVNEVFADHDSSRNPIDVPRDWLWNLPRRTVYFGTSIPSIFKGLTTEGIQHCFWKGFVCVRGFDRTLRAPRPLFARLHFPASKATRNRKATAGAATTEE